MPVHIDKDGRKKKKRSKVDEASEEERKAAEKFAANAGMKKGTPEFKSTVSKFLRNIKDNLDRPSTDLFILMDESGSASSAVDSYLHKD